MTMANLSQIYDWFMTGKKPTQAQFWASWGSFWNKEESIPQSAISNLSTTLNAKAEKAQFDAHKTAADAHQALFDLKQSLTDKGAQGGYAPLDEFTKLAAEYLNIVDDLVTGGSTALLSAEQGKVLKGQIDAINLILTSDDINLDTVQELVNAIKEVETSLETILVNDLTTGGTTKALTAEMGKSLKALIDALYSNETIDTLLNGKSDKILSLKTITGTAYSLIADDSLVELVYEGTAPMTVTIPNNSTVALPIGTVFYTVATNTGVLSIAGAAGVTFQTAVGLSGAQNEVRKYTKRATNVWGIEGNVVSSADMILANTQTVSGLKTFLNSMFGLRNSANTFTNLFSVITTAARTWTWPDKSGTVAMTSDIPTNIVATGTQNKLAKYNNAGGTQVGNSRIEDNGMYLGVDTQWPLSADFLFGYIAASRTFGIEDSISNQAGRDFIIKAGRAINFNPIPGTFNSIGQSGSWYYLAINSTTNDVYAVVNGGGIYKQTAGGGNFVSLGQASRAWRGIAINSSNNDVYATTYNGDIYKQTAGSGNFVSLGQASRGWWGIAINSTTNDVYAVVNGGDIYKQTAGSGNFVALGQTSRAWEGIAINSTTNDVYASGYNIDIYKQTAGSGNFNTLNQTIRSYRQIAINSLNGDVYIVANNEAAIYKQTAGSGNFVSLGQASRGWWGIAVNSTTGDVYASDTVSMYVLQNDSLGAANLNGGTLKVKAGTGKGTGQSRIQFITGQKTTPGTDMQLETVRGYFDENGYFICLNIPSYANDSAADADTNLPSGSHYKITGSRQLYQKP